MNLTRFCSVVLDTLFGERQFCPACGRSGSAQAFCNECMARIPRVSSPACSVCGTPLRGAASAGGENEERHAPSDTPRGAPRVCAGCRFTHRYFACARAPAVYEGAAREHVHDLKYRARVEIVPALSRMMATCAIRQAMADWCDCVVAVPLHPHKLARRGFNQAELLAGAVASLLGAPLIPGALSRRESTGTQTFLDRQNRQDNVRHAFTCDEPGAVAGRRVLLVDDVLTSGATADGCARGLLRSGASGVKVLTFAVSVADERDWSPV